MHILNTWESFKTTRTWTASRATLGNQGNECLGPDRLSKCWLHPYSLVLYSNSPHLGTALPGLWLVSFPGKHKRRKLVWPTSVLPLLQLILYQLLLKIDSIHPWLEPLLVLMAYLVSWSKSPRDVSSWFPCPSQAKIYTTALANLPLTLGKRIQRNAQVIIRLQLYYFMYPLSSSILTSSWLSESITLSEV